MFSAENLLSPIGMMEPEVFLEQFGVFAQTGVGVDEDHALLLQVLTDLVVHDLRLVLCSHTRDEGVTPASGMPRRS